MHLRVTDHIALTELRSSDQSACIQWINDRAIYDGTLRIPYPYSAIHFEQWLTIVNEQTGHFREPIQFAIREGELFIGCIGFEELVIDRSAEIGYWLAKPWWGRGLMTAVVAAACDYAVDRWKLKQITAHVFLFNDASTRVLEKNSFQYEGVLREYREKEGVKWDCKRFVRHAALTT